MGRKKGQSIVEFTLIGLLVLAASLGGIFFFGGSIGDLFEQNNSQSMFNSTSRTALDPPICPYGSTLHGSYTTSWACINNN